jgi:hypothetical protein
MLALRVQTTYFVEVRQEEQCFSHREVVRQAQIIIHAGRLQVKLQIRNARRIAPALPEQPLAAMTPVATKSIPPLRGASHDPCELSR